MPDSAQSYPTALSWLLLHGGSARASLIRASSVVKFSTVQVAQIERYFPRRLKLGAQVLGIVVTRGSVVTAAFAR
jgi:hypothetical protein